MVLGQLMSEMFIATIQAKFQVSFINPFHVTSSSAEVFLMAQTTFSCLRGQFSGYSLWALLFKQVFGKCSTGIYCEFAVWVILSLMGRPHKRVIISRTENVNWKGMRYEGLCLLLLLLILFIFLKLNEIL